MSTYPPLDAIAGWTAARRREALVVEHDPDLLATVREALLADGFLVTAVSTSDEALVALEQGLRPAFVIVDLRLPTHAGEDLLRWLKGDERWRRIPVAAMTAYPAWLFDTLPLADALLPKPFTLDALEKLVAALCAPPIGRA
jgi:CheY-like chemotaxis protein